MTHFSGKEEDFPEWEVKMKSITSLIGIDAEMAVAVAEPTEEVVMLDALPDDTCRNKAKALYHMLIHSCGGKALTIILTCEEGNGLLAWRKLKIEYKPEVAPRHNAMLVALLTPHFVLDRPLTEQITEWKRNIDEYCKASGKPFDGSTKIAVLTQHAPAEHRAQVIAASARAGDNYEKLEREIFDNAAGSRIYTGLGILSTAPMATQGPTPMDVGGINQAQCQICGKIGHTAKDCWQRAGCGGGAGKGKGSHGKGKGKGSKGKGKGDGKARFSGKCNYCHNEGHMQRDCRKKKADDAKKTTVGGVEEAAPPPPASTQAAVPAAAGGRTSGGIDAIDADDERMVCGIEL